MCVHMEKVKNFNYEVISENKLIYQLRAGLYICSGKLWPREQLFTMWTSQPGNNRYFHSKTGMNVHEEPAHAASLELSAWFCPTVRTLHLFVYLMFCFINYFCSQRGSLCWTCKRYNYSQSYNYWVNNKQLLDEVEHDIMNYQNRGLCYLPKPKAEAGNTDARFW